MIILMTVGSACLAWLFVNTGVSFRLRRLMRWPHDRRMKPFDCELCLAFWMGLIGGVSPNTFSAGLMTYIYHPETVVVWLGPVWASINFETLSAFPLYTGGCAAVLAVFIKKLLQ